MNAIQEKVLNECVRKLSALGVQFAIVDIDGVKHGDLEIAEKKQPRKHHNNFMQYNYIDRVDAMQVGDVETFCADGMDHETRNNYRSAIVARGIKQFGKKTMMSTIGKDGSIEVLRVQ